MKLGIKIGLFWKILIGFWITFVLVMQVLFSLLDPGEMSERMRAMARMTVAAVTSVIHENGEPALQARLRTWPYDQRRQVVILPQAAPYDSADVLAQEVAVTPNGHRYRVLYLASPQGRGRHMRSIFALPPQVVVSFGIGGLLFAAVLAWYLTRPVRLMQRAFDRVAQGDFTPRLAPAMGRRRDEIAELGRDFDSMAVRLEELVAARDRLLADVSHELRTPLARLNLAIGLARQDPAKLAAALDRIGVEAGKLDEMVGELLTLARLESGHPPTEEYFDFAEVVKIVAQDARYEAGSKNVQVLLSGADDSEWIVPGSGKLVARAVENIVRNALRYSPDGGQVALTLRRGDGLFELCVADNGPGVTEADMGALFRPFGVSADGSGFGLGLAIARRAIAVHGGAIIARNRQPHGLEMRLTLPSVA